MSVKSELFRRAVSEAVWAMAIESWAQSPQGLTDRSFESIVAALMMADWEYLAERVPFAQAVDRICGTERCLPLRLGHRLERRKK